MDDVIVGLQFDSYNGGKLNAIWAIVDAFDIMLKDAKLFVEAAYMAPDEVVRVALTFRSLGKLTMWIANKEAVHIRVVYVNPLDPAPWDYDYR